MSLIQWIKIKEFYTLASQEIEYLYSSQSGNQSWKGRDIDPYTCYIQHTHKLMMAVNIYPSHFIKNLPRLTLCETIRLFELQNKIILQILILVSVIWQNKTCWQTAQL